MNEDRIVRLGDRTYRVEAPWGELPAGRGFEVLSQVAVDSRGRVYALQRSEPPVLVFDRDGRFMRSIGDGQILDGHGIAVDPADRIWVIDRDAHQIIVFDPDGFVVRRVGERGAPRHGEPFNHPTDVAFAADGEFYVTDGYGNACVHRFSADGRHISSWGTPGNEPGCFSTPHAVWVDRSDRVIVADRENDRVQVFDRTGGILAIWTDVYRPMDIFEDDRGFIFVSDQVPRVSMFAPDGTLAGRARPVLNGAHGLWGDRDGSIYCAEMIPPRLAKLRPRRAAGSEL